MVYLIPSDKDSVAEKYIEKTILHLRAWYQLQMGGSKTFTLDSPVVKTFRSTHDSLWYANTPNKGNFSNVP